MVQGKITEADIQTIRLTATPSGLITDPPPSIIIHTFLRRMPFLPQPSHFILAWGQAPNMLACIASGVVK